MKDREQEYRELFIAEALHEWDEMNRHIVELEKFPEDEQFLSEIFRLLHNMKANAKAIGFNTISELSHKLETIFSLIRTNEIEFKEPISSVLFKGIDMLGNMLRNIDDENALIPDESILKLLDDIISEKEIKSDHRSVLKNYAPSKVSLSDLIYIQVKKLDELMNLVGELIIDRDRIASIAERNEDIELRHVSSHLERVTKDLQTGIMDARLVNMGNLFNKIPKIIRDISKEENKLIDLSVTGQDIQIDRNILQKITDAVLHILRNAIAHGIEKPEERIKRNKPEMGSLEITAHSDKDIVIIEVRDDGNGIDVEKVKKHAVSGNFISADRVNDLNEKEALSFIFEPGFSLSDKITEVSGRGVGLDIVKNTVDSIGGKVEVISRFGKGTTFRLILPNSIALTGALLFEVLKVPYAIPLIHIESVSRIPTSHLHFVGKSAFIEIEKETIPVLYLREFFNSGIYRVSELVVDGDLTQNLIIVSYNNRKLGLIADALIRQQEIVVKPLQNPIADIDLYSGVTVLGTGEVCLVLDVPSMSRQFSIKRNPVELNENI